MKKRIFRMLLCAVMVCFLLPISAFAANLYVASQDIEEPVFEGIKNDEIYCQSVKFKVTDNDSVASVKAGETQLTADEDGYYTLTCGNDLVVEYTVTATDFVGNKATVSLTIIGDHRMSGWDGDGEYIWRICTFCGVTSNVKYEKPEVHIVGDDTVCRSERYQFTVTIPNGCEFSDCIGPIWQFTPQLQADGTYLCVIENDGDYHGRDSINIRMDVILYY